MISKELLKEILLEQRKKVERQRNEDFVIREKLGQLEQFITTRHCIIITGPRRCGKSVFLLQILNKLPGSYYYVNFEDERLAGFTVSDFNRLYETCIELFGQTKTFLLDEVQNIAGWERWVRRMYEDNFKFFLTGSNATLLSKELATLLTGRHLQFLILPFSFREFLSFHKCDFKREDFYITEKRALMLKLFSEYLIKGGFPEYLKYGQIEILQEYFNDIIQKDIVERYKVKNIKQLKELARYLITNTGNLTTYNQLKKLTEVKSVNTAINYVSFLENGYLLLKIPYFSYSLKKQTANPFKVFATDTGIRSAISFKSGKDLGRIYETIVAIELKRKGIESYYWKNYQHEEVDFIIRENKVKQLIQVCYDIDDDAVKSRELKALIKASKELKCRNLLIITGNHEAEETIKGNKVRFIPLWKWLLS